MTLSSLEAKWVAFSEAIKVIVFMIQLTRRMKISIMLTVTEREDNVGAIFLAINITTASHTKVDIMFKYVNKYVEDGILKMTATL